jgi:hypothetical protein
VHFSNSRTTSSPGGAITINEGNLTLESCIFSDNWAGDVRAYTPASRDGGAIYNSSGTLAIRACTFYNNYSSGEGAAIYNNYSQNINNNILSGNLFFRNITPHSSMSPPVRYFTSRGYNVVDRPFGTGDNQSGFNSVAGDKSINSNLFPLSPGNFGVAAHGGATGVTDILPEDYPAFDFYGNPIPKTNATAGAVQAPASNLFEITDFSDSPEAANTPGTLRHALDNIENGDFIVFVPAVGRTTIALTGELPEINKNVTIEGNGITMTKDASWNSQNSDTGQLLRIKSLPPNTDVTIRRIHFTGGYARNYGGAINTAGVLNLESCIFTSNTINTGGGHGGVIYVTGGATVRITGCTFYNNPSSALGGIIYNDAGYVPMRGNIFKSNGGETRSRIGFGPISSLGFNVFDVPNNGNTSTNSIGFSRDSTDLLNFTDDPFESTSGANAFRPRDVRGLHTLWLYASDGFRVIPIFDFNGNLRTFPGASGAVRQP